MSGLDEDESNDELTSLLVNHTGDSRSDGVMHRINNRNLYLACTASLFLPLSSGVVLGMSSPMIPDMRKDHSPTALDMTESDYSWFGSLINVGGIVGGLLGGVMMQLLGRKPTVLLCSLPYVGGMLMIAYAGNIPTLLLGRTLTGVACAILSIVGPAYLSETSTENIRGVLGALSQMMVCTGILLAYIFGIFLSWRWIAMAASIPCVLWTISTYFIPETPRFLLICHKRNEARQSLVILRGREADVDSELDAIEESINKTPKSASWINIFKERSIRMPLFIGLGMAFFHQWNGEQCILLYSKSILQNAGFTSENQLNAALIVLAAIQIVVVIIPSVLLDRVGRKAMLFASCIIMAVCSATFGLYLQLTTTNNNVTNPDIGDRLTEALFNSKDTANLNWLAVSTLVVYVAGFNVGIGPIFWLMVSEFIPMRARGKASGLVICSNWAAAFVVTKEFYNMQEAFTPQGTFWIFSGISIAGILYHQFLVPETKGRTLEQIAAYFERGPMIKE